MAVKSLIKQTIISLAKNNEAFCSEAHFQHELGMALSRLKICKRIILERSCRGLQGNDIYLDIWMKTTGGRRIGIELKYKTAETSFFVEGDEVKLRDHMATDGGRYGFWFDVHRLEELIKANKLDLGYVVFLSNAHSYWDFEGEYKNGKKTQDHNFHMVAKRFVAQGATLAWDLRKGSDEKPKKTKGKHWTKNYPPIQLFGEYVVPTWQDFSVGAKFKFLLMEVKV